MKLFRTKETKKKKQTMLNIQLRVKMSHDRNEPIPDEKKCCLGGQMNNSTRRHALLPSPPFPF